MIMKGWEAEGFECESTGHITPSIKQVSRARGSGEGPAPRTPGSSPASPPHSSGFSVASCPGWRGSLLPKPHPPQPSCLPWSPLACCLRWSGVTWGLIVRPAPPSQAGHLHCDLCQESSPHQAPFYQGPTRGPSLESENPPHVSLDCRPSVTRPGGPQSSLHTGLCLLSPGLGSQDTSPWVPYRAFPPIATAFIIN